MLNLKIIQIDPIFFLHVGHYVTLSKIKKTYVQQADFPQKFDLYLKNHTLLYLQIYVNYTHQINSTQILDLRAYKTKCSLTSDFYNCRRASENINQFTKGTFTI